MNVTDTNHPPVDAAFCPYFHEAAELIGRRWTGAILRALFSGYTHFNCIKSSIPELTARMLSERLKELEVEGIVTRHVIANPLGTEYLLTPKGEALRPVLESISDWAYAWLTPEEGLEPAAPAAAATT